MTTRIPSHIWVYTTFHGADTVEVHLDVLDKADIDPDVVALEVPESGIVSTGAQSLPREALKRSPATGLLLRWASNQHREDFEASSLVSDRGDSEFEAGRQFAADRGVPVVNADLARDEICRQYFSPWRVVRDTVAVLLGLGTFLVSAMLVVVGAFLALGSVLEFGFSSSGVFGVVLGAFIVFVGYLFFSNWLPRIVSYLWGDLVLKSFIEGIRSVRDAAMFETITDSCDVARDTVLLVVGKSHFEGIAGLADEQGIVCEEIESPAVGDFETVPENPTIKDLEEIRSP